MNILLSLWSTQLGMLLCCNSIVSKLRRLAVGWVTQRPKCVTDGLKRGARADDGRCLVGSGSTSQQAWRPLDESAHAAALPAQSALCRLRQLQVAGPTAGAAFSMGMPLLALTFT